jgi:hypothetical protein
MSSPAASLDPRITLFARDASSIMSAEQAGKIIGLSRHSICALCHAGQIDGESVKTNKNGHGSSLTRWNISRAAVLRYIIRSTSGDRCLVLQAVDEECPAWSKRAQAFSAEPPLASTGHMPSPPAWLQERAKARAPRPARAGADPHQDHPDLFSTR